MSLHAKILKYTLIRLLKFTKCTDIKMLFVHFASSNQEENNLVARNVTAYIICHSLMKMSHTPYIQFKQVFNSNQHVKD